MKTLHSLAATTAAFLFALAPALTANDWPQFRGDSGRTASSTETLPAKLHLQWVREFPEPRPAFPTEVRLAFDASYEPVVAGGVIFVPSMRSNSLTAFDTATGAERWHFITGGPVRFAPSIANGRAYVASDDGYLYCLDTSDGGLIWKFRGLPAERDDDRKLLGHGRLISLFPARGGPVVHEGFVYFAAGLWPGDGVFVHAVDAKTGKARWSNTDSNRLAQANLDHGIMSEAGITPQGYLAVSGDKLIVPCGAQLPAILDLKTGELDPYSSGWGGRVGLPKGSWFVAAQGRFLSASGDLYDLARPNQQTDMGFKRDRKPENPSMVYPSGLTRLMIDPTNQRELGEFRQPILSPNALIFSSALAHLPGGAPDTKGSAMVAYDLANVKLREVGKEIPAHRANDQYPDLLGGEFQELWRLPSALKVHIYAGSRLYAGGPGMVQAIDLNTKSTKPAIAWNAKIEGTPSRMLAANGELFVVTLEGRLYAFGAEEIAKPAVHSQPQQLLVENETWKARATQILEASGQPEGYAVVLGLESGGLVEELLRQSSLDVIALDPDAAKVAQLRERFFERGLYGDRVVAIAADPLDNTLPPYLANLVVTEASSSAAPSAVFRLLRPYGGIAVLNAEPDLSQQLLDADLPGSAIREAGDWVVYSREGALDGATDWSHTEATSGNAGASQDLFVKTPLGLLWFDSSIRWHRKPGSAAVRVAGGRVFINAENLLAVDAYTGRHLWETSLPKTESRDGFVAVSDAVYVIDGKRCLVLDATDGSETGEIALPADVAAEPNAGWEIVRVWGDYLVGTSREHLICIDRRDGSLKWQFKCRRRYLSVAVGSGKVFCSVLMNKRIGETEGKTHAFDLATGELVWENNNGLEIRYGDSQDVLVTGMGVYSGLDGSKLRAGADGLLVAGSRLIKKEDDAYTLFDLSTGVKDAEHPPWTRRGCTKLRFSPNMATTRYLANAAYVDLTTQKITPLWNMRSGCNNNLFPADGLLNIPNISGGCECNYTPTSIALAPLAEIVPKSEPKD